MRRRRLVALLVAVGVAAVLAVALVVGQGSRDAYAGTWGAAGGNSIVITHVSGNAYTVVIGAGHHLWPAVCSGKRLTVAAAAEAARGAAASGALDFRPGPGGDTLEECFPDGTSTVLTRH